MKVIELKDNENTRLDIESISTYRQSNVYNGNKLVGYRLWVGFKVDPNNPVAFEYTSSYPPENEILERHKLSIFRDIEKMDQHFGIVSR